MKCRAPKYLAIVAVFLCRLTVAVAGNVDYQIVAQKGDAAPGGGTYSYFFDPPVLNNNGEVLFYTYNDAIYGGAIGNLALIAKKGGAVPGLNGATYSNFRTDEGYLGISDSGSVFYRAYIDFGGDTVEEALFSGPVDSPSLLARTGMSAPGRTENFASLGVTSSLLSYSPCIGADGKVLFDAELAGYAPDARNDRSGIWLGTPGNLSYIIGAGDTVPGLQNTVNIAGYSSLSRDGSILFFVDIYGATLNTSEAYYFGKPGSFSLVARWGDPAPGTNGTFGGCSNNGCGAFDAQVFNTDTIVLYDGSGTWVRGGAVGGQLTLFGHTGDPVMDGYSYSSRPECDSHSSGRRRAELQEFI